MKISEKEAEGRARMAAGGGGWGGECQQDNIYHIVTLFLLLFFSQKGTEEKQRTEDGPGALTQRWVIQMIAYQVMGTTWTVWKTIGWYIAGSW